MQAITVTTQGGYRRTVISDYPLELGESCGILEHCKLAVCIARIIAGAKFHNVDVERLHSARTESRGSCDSRGVKTPTRTMAHFSSNLGHQFIWRSSRHR